MAKHRYWMGWLICGAVGLAATARADVLYDMALTSTQGHGQENGTVSLNQAPPATGTVIYQVANPIVYSGQTPGYDITGFSLGGLSLTSSYGGPVLNFTNDVPLLFLYVDGGERSTGFYTFNISGSGYTSSFISFPGGGIGSFPVFSSDAGTVAITPATLAVAPEPGGVALLGTGMVGVAGVLRRRSSRVTPVS